MSTNASISKMNENGTLKTVYLHWDGYVKGAGLTLKTAYATEEAIDELLSYGDISELGESVDQCVFYGRDRNEDNTEARTYSFLRECILDEKQEYNYVFVAGKWMVGNENAKSLKEFHNV